MKYFICSNCKICLEGHTMFKCYSLKSKSLGGIYSLNNYTCDICVVEKQIGMDGFDFVWHCNACEYDVCPAHFPDSVIDAKSFV